jgi:hypothetical protein
MRVFFGLLAAAMLVLLAQPALAVCLIRGGTVSCYDDPKYWEATILPETKAPGGASVKAIVLRESSAQDNNAWVMTRQNSNTVPASGTTNAAAPACSLGVNC